jgi:hypothetical protein
VAYCSEEWTLQFDFDHMEASLASFAQYFRIGLEVGLYEPEEARDWAISVIDRMDEPPSEIIEVSWHKPLAQLISDLNEVKGEPEISLVCKWLLGRHSQTLKPSFPNSSKTNYAWGSTSTFSGPRRLYIRRYAQWVLLRKH